jgi:hypothetical protein
LDALAQNLSFADRAVRLALGGACLALPLTGWLPDLVDTGLLLFAWVPLVTGLIGWCPFYTLLGLSTYRR